jgi:hypothetical protein
MTKKRSTSNLREASIALTAVLVMTVGCSNAVYYEVAGLTDQQRVVVRRALTADQLKELDDWMVRKSNMKPEEQPPATANLSPDEKDHWLAKAGKSLPPGITVEQALKDQGAWLAQQKIDREKAAEKEKAEQAQYVAKQAGFAKLLSVALLSKGNEVLKDDKNYVVLGLSYENKGDRDIRGVEGTLKFSDGYGNSIADIKWAFQGSIPAKQTAFQRDVDINVIKSSEPLENLWETDFEKLAFTFEINSIAFSDQPSGAVSANKAKH